jgi:CheY-like chemotaxis protein
VYAVDPKILQKLEAHVRRVLIIDPNPAASRLLADQMKGLGARDLYFEPEERRALEMARECDPCIIFVECGGPKLDGGAFTRKLRRSNLACRMAPVIMMTSDATAATIKDARDSGVHEFLRKPFTAGDLLKRVMAVAIKPRDWIEGVGYVGPDRRRFNSAEFSGSRKRKADKAQSEAEAQVQVIDQAVRILRAALNQFDNDPNQALRSMRDQATTLKQMATSGAGEARLAVAVSVLEMTLANAAPTRADLEAPVKGVLALYPTVENKSAA